MENEFTRRLQREGVKGIVTYLASIFKQLKEIKDELQEIKKKQKPAGKSEPTE